MTKKVFFLVFLVAFLYSCTTENKIPEDNGMEINNELFELTEDEINVMTIPSLLQVATVLKLNEDKYRENLPVPVSTEIIHLTSSKLQALNLGIYSIDMGYATLHGQAQAALQYLSKMEKLMFELGISSTVSIFYKERFEKNQKNLDSLCTIILESGNTAFNYFKNNKREDIGLLVLTGAYIEGLNLLVSSNMKNKGNAHFFIQHKEFLLNIIKLLSYYDMKNEHKEIIRELKLLYKLFENVNMNKEDIENNQFWQKTRSKDFNDLIMYVSDVRNNWVNKIQ